MSMNATLLHPGPSHISEKRVVGVMVAICLVLVVAKLTVGVTVFVGSSVNNNCLLVGRLLYN